MRLIKSVISISNQVNKSVSKLGLSITKPQKFSEELLWVSILEKARKIINENQDLLTVFEEFDRTGKFRKRSYKVRATFTIDESLLNEFRQYCRKNNINMSSKIESFMREEMRNDNKHL